MAEQDDKGRNGTTEPTTDKRKQSLYFPEVMLREIQQEAARLDRSLSWVMQRTWKTSRAEVRKLPSLRDVDSEEDKDKDKG
jgi:uncharacterized small protein (TIGR04563 family)